MEGQYVVIDGLKAGIYILENQVNGQHLLPELNYTNNSAALRLRFTPGKAMTPAIVEVLGPLP